MKKVKFSMKKVKILVFLFFIVGVLIFVGFLIYKGFKCNKEASPYYPLKEINNGFVVENQLAMPQKGEQIAVFKVQGYGSFKCRLFDKAMPNTVRNFVKLVKAKKYDGLSFDEIISDLKIQCGDDADGVSDVIPKEFNASLHSYNGALCAVCSEELDSQTGQFYIVYSEAGRQTDFDYLENNYSEGSESGVFNEVVRFNESVRSNYKEHGGFPAYDLEHGSVFGQVFEGLDVVEKIMNCPKSLDNLLDEAVPVNPIIIDQIEIVTA